MQTLLLVVACWVFWMIVAVDLVSTAVRSGVYLAPMLKLLAATAVAWYVSAVIRSDRANSTGGANPDADSESDWKPMPIIVRVVLSAALVLVGVYLIAFGAATPLFGGAGILIAFACFALAAYVLFAGKYNPNGPL